MRSFAILLLLTCCVRVGVAQQTASQQQAATDFRQSLIEGEAARKQAVAQFLNSKVGLRQSFTDAQGAFHFLHHIDTDGTPIYYNTRSNLALATSIGTSKLWSGGSLGLNLQGQGMEISANRSRLGMWEPGPTRTTHHEFGGRAITRDTPLFTIANGNADHATHVAGTMIATGVQAQARGMANQAILDCFEVQSDELVEMQTAASEGMLVSNHSYGPDFDTTRVRLGVYGAECRSYDQIAFQNRNYLQFHAAGNDRNDDNNISYDILIGGALGKNVVAVGAVRNLGPGGYTGPASVSIANFSSYGPADDGRIKPDFVAPGVAIYSPYSATDQTYSISNGTSMASPGAAGSLFLLQQHARNTRNALMRSATLKGLAIHTADEAGANPGPDYAFGWGLLNLEKAINLLNLAGGTHLLEETSIADKVTYRKTITSTGGPFKATLCWTDVPGTPLVNGGINNRTPILVNDLDLRVIDLATNQPIAQLPWRLAPANPTAAATQGDNVVDNVEQVFVENLPAGLYALQVTNKGTLQQGPQEFSIFATGITRTPVLSSIGSISTCTGVATETLSVSVADAELASVTLTASSNNTALLPSGNIVVGGSGANRTVVATPAPGQSGTALITLIVTNNASQTASTSFTLAVIAPTVTITIAPSPTITQGQTATLTASGANSFSWSTGATTAAVFATVAGTYSVTGATGGCSATTSATLIVQPVACTTFTTLKAGLWNDPTVWSCGIVPTSPTTVVEINHVIGLPGNYTAQAGTVRYGLTGRLTYQTGARLQMGL